MAARTCSSCGASHPKSEYSKNQWSKKKDAAKCRGCVAGNGGGGAPSPTSVKTDHLIHRQRQRNISDSELAAAIECGERIELSGEDGAVRYSYKGVVYVATSEGVGITAYRLDPMQCTCNIRDQSKLCNDFGYQYMDGHRCNRVEHALNKFQLELMKWRRNSATCDNLSDSPVPFCMGGNTCAVHRTPTDYLAMLLERRKWASPAMQDVMSDRTMVGKLILAAAGSLLRPVVCKQCHGVMQLQRSPNPYDESDTLPWLRQLLDATEADKHNQKLVEDKRTKGCPESSPDLYCDPLVAGFTTALGAAALAGNYRCAAELIRRGASVEMAVSMFEFCPLEGGHLPCYLMLQSVAPCNRQFRQSTMCSRYEEILALFAHADGREGFCEKADEKQDRAIKILSDKGLWERFKKPFERSGFSVLGHMNDGLCIRFIIKGGDDESYADGAAVASTLAIKLPEAEQWTEEPSFTDPVGDPIVMEFVRRYQSKAQKRSCHCHGNSCCTFSRYVNEILKEKKILGEDRMLRVVEERWKKMRL